MTLGINLHPFADIIQRDLLGRLCILSEKEKLQKLRAENRRLRRENEYLRHRLSMPTAFAEKDECSPSEKLFAQRLKQKSALRARSYFGYLLERLRKSRPFLIYDKTRFAVRGLFFVTKIWTLVVWMFAFLGIGAQFLLIAGALAVFFPAAFLFSSVLGLYGYFAYRKWNKLLFPRLSRETDARIWFFFLPKGKQGAYFSRWLSSIDQKSTVFLVSFSFRDCGFSGVRQTDVRTYIIHISYYFSLVKRLDHERIVKIF